MNGLLFKQPDLLEPIEADGSCRHPTIVRCFHLYLEIWGFYNESIEGRTMRYDHAAAPLASCIGCNCC